MAANKTDMERIGLFSEQGYTTLGDRYPKTDPRSKPFFEAAYKGKQMLPGGSKTRSALQAGYFDSSFKRVMEKESYTDSIKNRRLDRIAEDKKKISPKAFLPSSYTKKPSGKGNTYGTFAGTHKSFSPNLKPGKPYVTHGRNFTTTPGKKGTGYGYVNVTFQKYNEHSIEPYEAARETRRQNMNEHKGEMKGGSFKLGMHPKSLFDQNIYRSDRKLNSKGSQSGSSSKPLVVKIPFRPSNPARKIAGCKAGTFGDYPKHSADPYIPVNQVLKVLQNKQNKATSSRGIFHPQPGPKSIPTKSVLEQNVIRAMNRNNYKNVKTMLAF